MGFDLVAVQQLMGHGSISMTMRYSHLAPEHRAKAVKILDSALSFSPTQAKTQAVNNQENQQSASY